MTRVLVVDDDVFNATLYSKSVEALGGEAVVAHSAEEARARVESLGLERFACVLTDYRMPGENGLGLLRWLRSLPGAPATILITAEKERALIRQSLRGGAVDFLEKPVPRAELEQALRRAFAETARLRQLDQTQQQVRETARVNHLFQHIDREALGGRLRLAFHPRHEVGGDFVNVLPDARNPAALTWLIGDVSGHDLRAGFVSAYFQGMARGLLDRREPLQTLVAQFNRTLVEDWARAEAAAPGFVVGTSLSICAARVDPAEGVLEVLNCGFPALWLVDCNGGLRQTGRGHPPLGWFETWTFEPQRVSLKELARVYVCTDGLHEYAAYQGLGAAALADALLRQEGEMRAEQLAQAQDDILIMSLDIDAPGARASADWRPVLSEQYAGSEADAIDRFQNIWRRSLQYALPKTADDRLYDFLLCCREAVLNGLIHGCERAPDKLVDFTVTFNEATGQLVGRVADPGHGHSFDVEHRIGRLPKLDGAQLGLTIIRQLSDRSEVANNGSTVMFEFRLR
ncbi:MAG: SpoIIE family protein phosphatase [Opitutales bacterium]